MHQVPLIVISCFLVLLAVQSSFTIPITKGSARTNIDNHTIHSRHARSMREYSHTCSYCWNVGKYKFCKTVLESVADCTSKGGESSNGGERR